MRGNPFLTAGTQIIAVYLPFMEDHFGHLDVVFPPENNHAEYRQLDIGERTSELDGCLAVAWPYKRYNHDGQFWEKAEGVIDLVASNRHLPRDKFFIENGKLKLVQWVRPSCHPGRNDVLELTPGDTLELLDGREVILPEHALEAYHWLKECKPKEGFRHILTYLP